MVAGFVLGGLFSAPQPGDLQDAGCTRRVPPALLGRMTSLDFFVSLAFMPVSMALAGPISVVAGLTLVFLVAGLVPLLFGAVALVVGRWGRDELAHPLDVADEVPVA